MITIDDLRADWLKQQTALDDQIAFLEGGGRISPMGQDAERATVAWLEKLRSWRAEIDSLFIQFPKAH